MKELRVRHLRREDADTISKIYSEIIQKPAGDDFKNLIRSHAENAAESCFVAEMGQRVIGFMISYIMTMGFGINKSAWIATLGVDPAFMGQGIGRLLAEKTMEHYKEKGVKNVYTSVRWDSVDLLSFFKTLGFNRSNFINLRKVLD